MFGHNLDNIDFLTMCHPVTHLGLEQLYNLLSLTTDY